MVSIEDPHRFDIAPAVLLPCACAWARSLRLAGYAVRPPLSSPPAITVGRAVLQSPLHQIPSCCRTLSRAVCKRSQASASYLGRCLGMVITTWICAGGIVYYPVTPPYNQPHSPHQVPGYPQYNPSVPSLVVEAPTSTTDTLRITTTSTTAMIRRTRTDYWQTTRNLHEHRPLDTTPIPKILARARVRK